MIGEELVLLRIEYFEQRGRGIAPEVGRKLVDLIEQDQRVNASRLLHCADDAARHRADVSAAVAPNLRFVAHASKTDPHEVAAHGGCDRAAKACLAYAWRTGE